MNFVKMEGLGNDFIVTHVNSIEECDEITAVTKKLCDRHFGIGADGVIVLLSSNKADFKLIIFNSDGSEAEMCGNGIRCSSIYISENKLSEKSLLRFETKAGYKTTELLNNGLIKVDMGAPVLESQKIPTTKSSCRVIMHDLQVDCNSFKINAVSMGNPHAVIYVDELTDNLVTICGPKIEKHPFFPQKTNVEFVKVLSNNEIQVRIWERGCGETLACGTGACASVVSGIINNLHGNNVTVHLRGGDLFVDWTGYETDPVFMTGPAKSVFNGSISVLT